MSAFIEACHAIDHANSERDVVLAVQQFLASLSEEEHKQLPWGIFGKPIANVGDIALWALYFTRDSNDRTSQPGPAYGQAVRILNAAAERLVTLRERATAKATDRTSREKT